MEKSNILKKPLEYYMFDWDDNILEMPTMIHLDHLVNGKWVCMDVTTTEFTNVRHSLFEYYENNKNQGWRFRNDNRHQSYCDFRDDGPRGKSAFMEDTQKAIKYNNFGPVWDEFINCIVGGHIFMIITARGHEPETIKNNIKWIIYNILSKNQMDKLISNLMCWFVLFNKGKNEWTEEEYIDNYLNSCDFIAIESKWFINTFKVINKPGATSGYKALAIEYFVSKISKFGKVLERNVKVGFSDDDSGTIKSIHEFFKDKLSIDFPLDYHLYHTKKEGKIKIEI